MVEVGSIEHQLMTVRERFNLPPVSADGGLDLHLAISGALTNALNKGWEKGYDHACADRYDMVGK